jgi:hypothetical protein
MSRVDILSKWLRATPLPWSWSLGWGIAAITIPSLFRASLTTHTMWDCCAPYFPFMLLSAMLLGWKRAAVVALIAAVVSDFMFAECGHMICGAAYDLLHFTSFLGTSALIIGLVHIVRRLAEEVLRLTALGEPTSGIIFSLEAGEAWASWRGSSTPLRLGSRDEVAQMMRDFLAQVELGKRLTAQAREA